MRNLVELIDELAAETASRIAAALDPVISRVNELHQKVKDMPAGPQGLPGKDGAPGERGAPGKDGKDGKDAAPLDIEAIVATLRAATTEAVRAAAVETVAAMPVPKDGKDGAPGRDGHDGKDGAPGRDGHDGKDGQSVDMAMLKSHVAAWVRDAVNLLAPKDGKDGKDGASVHPDTIALMVREAADKLVGNLPKPKDGKDGRDGFGLENFEMTLADDGRTLALKFTRGDLVVERAVRIPSVQYRGVFKDGDTYSRGDLATWGGSVWHCNVDGAKSKPDSGSGEWTLAVKRGRDGKEVVSTR